MKSMMWKGLYYDSLEYLNSEIRNEARFVEANIIGFYNGQFWYLNYQVVMGIEWVVKSFHISVELNGEKSTITGQNFKGVWLINDQEVSEFKGFKFIDISLTPFTNTLVINNLFLAGRVEQEVDVIYIDILEREVNAAKQRYTRSSPDRFLFQHLENDFEALILVDGEGFVLDYPEYFKRVGI
ncbi:putative glycolipid-binding domain-containing protein [Sphingobacterium hotanense]|uniref:putative glycolipid-binding domain-containing protein n=1 Tax=Sphingobacterium hotanense TaxID=649196 RepID=UPI0021A90D51|nr:putative glycolipid-binding domain-containing protein [Sphingobacterium hotanense]MCT1527002.1 putative glycolipid-binding domain-containing protein [Sphingobacterium hotanense]